jgi:hypothetical protein
MTYNECPGPLAPGPESRTRPVFHAQSEVPNVHVARVDREECFQKSHLPQHEDRMPPVDAEKHTPIPVDRNPPWKIVIACLLVAIPVGAAAIGCSSRIRGDWSDFSDFWISSLQPALEPAMQAQASTKGMDDESVKQVIDSKIAPALRQAIAVLQQKSVRSQPVEDIKKKAEIALQHTLNGWQILSDAISKNSADLAAEGKRRLGRGDELFAELIVEMNAMTSKHRIGVKFD